MMRVDIRLFLFRPFHRMQYGGLLTGVGPTSAARLLRRANPVLSCFIPLKDLRVNPDDAQSIHSPGRNHWRKQCQPQGQRRGACRRVRGE